MHVHVRYSNEYWTNFSATTTSKSKIFSSLKATLGYEPVSFIERNSKDYWPNDNPFTTTSTVAPITVGVDKVTQTQTAMLEVFQWLYSSTMKPIISTMSTFVTPSTTASLPLERDEWGNNIETYRVDEPPHSPGLSTECHLHIWFPAVEIIICVLSFFFVGLGAQHFIFTCTHVGV